MPALELPADFPAAAHARVRASVAAAAPTGEARRQFESAWTGCAHRFLSLARHDETFATSLRRAGRRPDPADLHLQEEALFAFVSCGVASVESLGYALYALAALARPDRFPIATPTDRRNATLGATMRGYAAELAEEEVTRALFFRLNSHEYGWWKEVRALLAQRLSPGRWPEEAGPEESVLHGVWMLRGEPVNDGLATRRRAWLAEALGQLVGETEKFVQSRLH
jgi:hypothetical protein